ncbi:TlpA family protein disulfide reductase [Tsukamurella conjunctivitidis]|uniref:TlpA family protein disulfide reductase n=2 Tax=Tsukamurella TaxID=2060 RepID=A0A5C5S7Z2_9ACTN|nr:TlpA family protein disulfide reductase [Tsukamurella columbiensis]TWS30992.1 TlpA family protein disulfide reductase [Tsukamurella conjunctivitidis]
MPGERSRVPAGVRWLIVCAIVALALGVAIWPRGDDGAAPPTGPTAAPSTSVSPGRLAAARASAALPPCPAGLGAAALAGTPLTCLGDGAPVDLAAAGTAPVLLNIWAWWCGPCRVELPVLADVAARAGDRLTVLGVHADANAVAGLDLLAELKVALPTVQDPQSVVATALGAPRAYPVTVLLRADGTVAGVHAQPFTSVDDVAALLRTELGVTL